MYIMMHEDEHAYLHKDYLLENLWPEYERARALPILQTSVCRIRSILSPCGERASLNYAGARYGLFLSGVQCDYIAAQAALAAFDARRRETHPPVMEACADLAKGLLPQNGYLWSIAKEEALRQGLSAALEKVISEYALPENRPARRKSLSHLALLNPANEDAQRRYLAVLEADGMRKKMVRHCAWLKGVLRLRYDEELPGAIRGIWPDQTEE